MTSTESPSLEDRVTRLETTLEKAIMLLEHYPWGKMILKMLGES
jgi:hypothetical protein